MILATDDEPERCILTSAVNVDLNPGERTRVNLGVSITPPCGTIATLAPINVAEEQQWKLCDHRMDVDATGEAVAMIQITQATP